MNKHFIAFFYLLSAVLYGAPPQVTTRVVPNPAALNDAIFLEVTIDQSLQDASFRLPTVDNLRLRYAGQSSQSRYINGVVERSTTWRFQVQVAQEGHYSIPAFECISHGNADISIPETHFTVEQAPQRQQGGGQSMPATAVFHLAGKIPQKWYVGQCCPLELQLLTPPTIRGQLSSLPTKESDAFSASQLLENPQQRRAQVQGQSCNLLAWPTLITALQSGQHRLNFSISLEIERQRRARDLLDDDPLGLFANLSSMLSSAEPLTLQSQPLNIEVLPLPRPQPQNFTQAIGTFQVGNPQVLERELIQHEPCSLQVKIQGSGNFENIQPPELQYDDTQWRVYDPKNHFEPKDNLGFEGMLEFTYTLVPLVEGKINLPKIVFTFFNLTTEQYETITRGALEPVTIKPCIHSPSISGKMPTVQASTPFSMGTRNIFIGKIVWETHQCHFWLVQGILALLTLAFIGIHLRTTNQTYRVQKMHQAQQQALYKRMMEAFKAQQSQAFYTALYELIAALLEAKNISIVDILEGLYNGLSMEQCALIQKIEGIYQVCRFGKADVVCPADLAEIKQLIHDLK